MKKPILIFLLSACAIMHAEAVIIIGVTAHVWPNERTSGNLPSDAIDGDLNTFTWSTQAFNNLDAHLGLDFGQLTSVGRIRLWKDDASGNDGDNGGGSKDLLILYTTDSISTPLSNRSFQAVSGLTNGFNGTELMDATSVSSNGIVTGDTHDSVNGGDGWASLSFNLVNATGIAIQFQGPETFNHYKVHEFEALGVPEPSRALLTLLAISSTLLRRRR